MESMNLPNVDLTSMNLPKVPDLGSVNLPKVDLQSIELPKVDFSSVEMPEMPELPKIDLKAISMPDIDVPSFNPAGLPSSIDIPTGGGDVTTLPTAAVLAGVGLVAVVLVLSAAAAGGGGEVSSSAAAAAAGRAPKRAGQQNSLAIPYDAAARLAYDDWCAKNDESFDEAGYAQFRKVYNTKAVADATAKKIARDLAMFKNEAPKEPPTRKIAPPKMTTTPKDKTKDGSTPFFAEPV